MISFREPGGHSSRKGMEQGSMRKHMYRAKKVRDLRKYLAFAGLTLILLGFMVVMFNHLSYRQEVKTDDVNPIASSLEEQHNSESIKFAAFAAIAVGAFLTYLGRKTT